MGRGLGDEAPQHAHPIGAAVEGQARLETDHLGGQRGQRHGGQVGRVGHDHVEAAPERGEGPEEIAGEKPHARSEPQRAHVVRGDGEGAQGLVDREQLEIGASRRQRARDRSAARPHVGHHRVIEATQELEGPLDQSFRFRTRDQHIGRHRQSQAPELLPAQNVLDGLVTGAAIDQLAIARSRLLVHGLLRLDVEGQAVGAEDGGEEQLGVVSRAVHTGLAQARGRRRETRRDRARDRSHEGSWSFLRCSSAARASTISSRSPSRMAGRR